LFLGFVVWIRLLIVSSIIAAYHYLKDILSIKKGCSVMGDTKRQKSLKNYVKLQKETIFFLARGGIIY
jgi:hypothetical protein